MRAYFRFPVVNFLIVISVPVARVLVTRVFRFTSYKITILTMSIRLLNTTHKCCLHTVCLYMDINTTSFVPSLMCCNLNVGSGKTSLLDVISCRGEGEVSGEICFRNRKCTRSLMKTYASYVMQADRLLPNLTVREALRYTAYLKLPGGTSKADVENKVDE